jgi:hypothetical protein
MEIKFDKAERPQSWGERKYCYNISVVLLLLVCGVIFLGIGIDIGKYHNSKEKAAIQHDIDSLHNISKDWNNQIDFQVNVYHNLQDSIIKKKLEWNCSNKYKYNGKSL